MGKVPRTEWTVGDLDAHGADSVKATCVACGREWRVMVRFLPIATTLPKVADLLECRVCGGQRVGVEPIWRRGSPALS